MKKTTKLLSLVIAVMLMASMLAVGISAENATAVWDGSKDTSWFAANSETKNVTITTAAQLAGIAELCTEANDYLADWTITLGADIVLNTGDAKTWSTETSPANKWAPITQFCGTLDGQGHKISGLYINEPATERVGFFAALDTATVKNVSFENACVIGRRQVGTVAGITVTAFSEITGVYSNAYVYSYPCYNNEKNEQCQAGGILGANATPLTEITECWFDGEVHGIADPHVERQPGVNDGSEGSTSNEYWRNDNMATSVGGICGFTNSQMEISDCLVTAKIVAHSQVGGIIGRVIKAANNTTLENCLVIVDITATRYSGNNVFVGEFLGITMDGSKTNVENCYGITGYAAKTIPEGTTVVGGASSVFGAHGGGGFTDGSTYDHVTLDAIKGDGAKTALKGFDFENTWATVEGGTPVINLAAAASDSGDGAGDNNNANNGNNADNKSDDGNNAADNKSDETTAPTTDTAKADDTTAEDKTEEKKSGCKSSVTVCALSVLAIAACGTAVVGKKRK